MSGFPFESCCTRYLSAPIPREYSNFTNYCKARAVSRDSSYRSILASVLDHLRRWNDHPQANTVLENPKNLLRIQHLAPSSLSKMQALSKRLPDSRSHCDRSFLSFFSRPIYESTNRSRMAYEHDLRSGEMWLKIVSFATA